MVRNVIFVLNTSKTLTHYDTIYMIFRDSKTTSSMDVYDNNQHYVVIDRSHG